MTETLIYGTNALILRDGGEPWEIISIIAYAGITPLAQYPLPISQQ